MPDRISIFDIPHITKAIGQYLDRRDLESCTVVSKSWSRQFRYLLWYELVLWTGRRLLQDPETRSAQERLFKDGSRWIRRLCVSAPLRSEDLLPLMSSTCTNLREFTCDISPGWDASFWNILDLVKNNKRLQHWSLTSVTGFSITERLGLVETLSCCHYLTELNLRLPFRPTQGWLQSILKTLPQTLKDLYLQWRQGYDDTGSLVDMPHRQFDWPDAYPYLERARFSMYLSTGDDILLFKFLERCPALKWLKLPKVLDKDMMVRRLIERLETTQLAPKRISVNLYHLEHVDEDDWGRLVPVMKGRIYKFVTGIKFNRPYTQSFIDMLTLNWAESLEVLRIEEPRYIKSRDIQLILTRCTRLRKLDCMCQHNNLTNAVANTDNRELAVGLKAMKTLDGNGDLDAMDWNCLDMEELQLSIADWRMIHQPQDEQEKIKHEEWTRQGIQHIYQQLGRLTKLRELELAWNTSQVFADGANFDMSLEAGLGHLKDLKMLQKLNLECIKSNKIGTEDLLWMRKSWPQLKRINGLRYRNRAGGSIKMDDSEYEQICRTLPNVYIG
ncbi:hypothetical protein BGX31_008596 [Mortierella sp. GBA43]|nr:hypothetical protein BGX31_008596 [Mortierella sp. GBA43]